MTFARAALALSLASSLSLVGCAPVTSDDSAPKPGAGGSGGTGGHAGSGGSGGQGGTGGSGGSGTNTPPTKQPPAGTGGGPTASACNGVTAKGQCEISNSDQAAVICDVANNAIQKFDCTAMKMVCVIDSIRGATCANLPPPTPKPVADMATPPHSDMSRPSQPPPHSDMSMPKPQDMASPMCASGVDYHGYCAASTAIWCDPTTGETIVVNCAASGQVCQEDVCAYGADCCDAPNPVDMAAAPSPECTSIGYAGACTADNHVRWCDSGTVYDEDCSASGESCQIDVCGSGAFCCPTADMSTDPDESRRGKNPRPNVKR
jgi:hypothetical protein